MGIVIKVNTNKLSGEGVRAQCLGEDAQAVAVRLRLTRTTIWLSAEIRYECLLRFGMDVCRESVWMSGEFRYECMLRFGMNVC